MKRTVFFLLACSLAATAPAQDPAPAQNIQIRTDGRCTDVHPGDTVHYALTIQSVQGDTSVLADLRLRLDGRGRGELGDLPLPDFRSVGGGGTGTRDAQTADVYHFIFKVPTEVFGGVYRGVGVLVSADEIATSRDHERPRVDVTRHTREQVYHYCLNVLSDFNPAAPTGRPEVINFEPGSVDPKK